MSWEEVSKAAQAELLESLPSKWKIERSSFGSLTDVSQIPKTCGILTHRQIEITELTATELAKRIARRELKAVDALEAFAARAAIAHQLVNCLASWFLEEGMRQAKHLDDILDAGDEPLGSLHGVPVALKVVRYSVLLRCFANPSILNSDARLSENQDTYSLSSHPTTWGYVINKGSIQDHDSSIVASLRSAGAVFFCRTCMPQTGMALETVSNLWGRTLNPFNTKLGAGGSSGGDGALVAMRGSPIAPSSDIGGSIRVPAAYNGLCGIRPTSLRIPKGGWESTMTGQISIRDSSGPVCHSVEDIRLFMEVINAGYRSNRYDVSSVPTPWRHVSVPQRKIAVGIMNWDHVVMPHPPILRALDRTKQMLIKAGFDVIEFEPPFDCWDLAKCTFDIYFQDGGAGTIAKAQASGEPLIPAFANLLKVYNARALTAAQVCQLNIKMREYKTQFAEAWERTNEAISSGRAMDALICPVAPSAGAPHDFNAYWGYTSMFNLLDYPSTVLPVANFDIDPYLDPVNPEYQPLESNPYDKAYHEMYDPVLYSNQPSAIQIVGRPFGDEELIEVTSEVDRVLKAASERLGDAIVETTARL